MRRRLTEKRKDRKFKRNDLIKLPTLKSQLIQMLVLQKIHKLLLMRKTLKKMPRKRKRMVKRKRKKKRRKKRKLKLKKTIKNQQIKEVLRTQKILIKKKLNH